MPRAGKSIPFERVLHAADDDPSLSETNQDLAVAFPSGPARDLVGIF